MERKLRFRVWNNVTKVMEFVGDIEWMNYLDNEIESICTESSKIKSPNFELMQYTGLPDKNGKEIYEDDIRNRFGKMYQKVTYWFGRYAWTDLEGILALDWLDPESAANSEIIGNIHENPELK